MDNKNTDLSFVNKMYRYMKNNMPVEEFRAKFGLSEKELMGLIELCTLYGKNISLDVDENGDLVFRKQVIKFMNTEKPDIDSDELIHTQFGLMADTHFGNNRQQLHLVNEFFRELYLRGIHIVYHLGDVVDGFYPNRKENPRLQFLHGFDEQVEYVVDMFPEVDGIITNFLLGSHDETHYKNGGATLGVWVPKCRPDMKYLGQDYANVVINNIRMFLDHPGDGKAKGFSYSSQKRIENLESGFKPHIYAIGHYHGQHLLLDRNVICIQVPSFCDKTHFQQKKALLNSVGAYIVDVYADKKGNIQYFEAEPMLWGPKDFWEENGKDKEKVRKLEIKNAA